MSGQPVSQRGVPLAEVRKRTEQRMRIDRISRGEGLLPVKEPSVQLQAGDRLYVRDTADNLKNYERLLGATLYNTSDVGTPVSAGAARRGGAAAGGSRYLPQFAAA
jgi:hypothetical protein